MSFKETFLPPFPRRFYSLPQPKIKKPWPDGHGKGRLLSHPKEPRRDHCVLIPYAMTERFLVKKPPAGKRQHQRAMKDTRLVQGGVPRLASLKNKVMEKLALAKSNTLIVTINRLLTLYIQHCSNPIIPSSRHQH